MRTFSTPRLVISRCIEHDHCRWNGLMIASDAVKLLKPYVELLPVCAEVEIGLGVPRDPVRVVEMDEALHLIQPATGRDCTGDMQAFAARYLDALPSVDGFILQSRSPSCGAKDVRVYPPGEKVPALSNKGTGFFAAAVLARYPTHPIEDEGRLTNYAIREHFFARIFALADWRATSAAPTAQALVAYQTRYKLLLMAHHQAEMRQLGRIVANHERCPLADVVADYGAHLRLALLNPARPTANINVLMHGLGYFSEKLSAAEKEFFLESLEDYRAEQVPLSVPTSILRAWIVRFGDDYLSGQAFFEPYPEGLIAISDSGRGRKL